MKYLSFLLFAIFCLQACSKSSSHSVRETKVKTEPPEVLSEYPTSEDAAYSDNETADKIPIYGTSNGHEWVDLGLSVLWATSNVCAINSYETGGLFAWGETKTKSYYERDNYFDCFSHDSLDNYQFGIYKLGGKTLIAPDSGHDTARENWGGSWRMPSNEEFDELCKYCTWEQDSRYGHEGCLVTGPNGSTIFLPYGNVVHRLSGDCFYWSNSLYGNTNALGLHPDKHEQAIKEFHSRMRNLGHDPTEIEPLPGLSKALDSSVASYFANAHKRVRFYGAYVRPVLDKDVAFKEYSEPFYEPEDSDCEDFPETTPATGAMNGHEFVDLGLSVNWATCNVGANSPSDYGGYYAWGDSSTKSEYYWSNCFDCVNPNHLGGIDDDAWGIYKTRDKTIITPESGHDTARENWGGSWRVPNKEDVEELLTKCRWEWKLEFFPPAFGNLVTGPNGNSIFLPVAGLKYEEKEYYVGSSGYYWINSLSSSDSKVACAFAFGGYDHDFDSNYRYVGLSVRPVFDKDHNPEFPGGESALVQFIGKNLRYPAFAKENGIKGLVTLSFIVEKDGSISDIQVVRSPYEDLTREAERIVGSMPNWNPAIRNGNIERMRASISIPFGIL